MSATVASRHGDSESSTRVAMTRDSERAARRFSQASILATLLAVSLGAGVVMTRGGATAPRPPEKPSVSAQAIGTPITNGDEFLTAVAARRELASVPLLVSDPSLQLSAQGWADELAGRGVGHDPEILDGVDDGWEQVAELVSSGPSFDAASRALLSKPSGASPLDDPTVTAFGVGNRVEGDTTTLVVRLLRTKPTGDVGVQMGF